MNTATQRLLEILEEVKKVKETSSFIDGWKSIFDAADNLETLRKIGLFYQLVDEAAKEIALLDKTQQPSVRYWRSQILNGLASSTTGSAWKEFSKFIDNHVLNYLRLQSTLVSHLYDEKSIPIEDLEKAKYLLQEALEELAASDLPADIKLGLVRRVRSLIDAIDDYDITGNTAVFEQLKVTIFDVAAVKRNDEKTPISKQLVNALSILSNAMTVASGIKSIAKPALKALGIIP